jgi:hypothetical protein
VNRTLTATEKDEYGRRQLELYRQRREEPSLDNRRVHGSSGVWPVTRESAREQCARQLVLDGCAALDRQLARLIDLGPDDAETLGRLRQALAGITRRAAR